MQLESKDRERQTDAVRHCERVYSRDRQLQNSCIQYETDKRKQLFLSGEDVRSDADRAANALNAAEAQVRTVEEQIRQLRTDLAYYRVVSPSAGIIGDVPVRVGDRVTKSTELTTVDSNTNVCGSADNNMLSEPTPETAIPYAYNVWGSPSRYLLGIG